MRHVHPCKSETLPLCKTKQARLFQHRRHPQVERIKPKRNLKKEKDPIELHEVKGEKEKKLDCKETCIHEAASLRRSEKFDDVRKETTEQLLRLMVCGFKYILI